MDNLKTNGVKPTVANDTQETPSNVGVRIARGPMAPINNCLNMVTDGVMNFFKKHSRWTKICFWLLLLVAFTAYLVAACVKDFDRVQDLFAVSMFGYFCLIYSLVKKYFGRRIWKSLLKPIQEFVLKYWKFFKW